MKFKLNRKKLQYIIDLVLSAYRQEQGVYVNKYKKLPQHMIPKGLKPGSLKHRQWLFYTTLLTTRSVSYVWFRSAKKMYENGNTDLFNPHWVVQQTSEEKLAEILKPQLVKRKLGRQLTLFTGSDQPTGTDLLPSNENSGTMHPFQAAHKWWGASQWLVNYGQKNKGQTLNLFADPAHIFTIHKNVSEVVRSRITGLGPKITSLLAIFYEELGIIPYFPESFPVDLHIMRLSYKTGILEISGEKINGEFLERMLRPFYVRNSFRFDTNPAELSNALWLLGAFGCVECARRKAPIGGCPLRELCPGTIETNNYRLRGYFSLPDDLRPFKQHELF